MNETLILLSIGATTILGVAALLSVCSDLLSRDQVRIQQRLESEFQQPEKLHQHRSPLFRDPKILESKTEIGQRFQDWWMFFEVQVEQSGLLWSPTQIIGSGLATMILSVATLCFLVPNPIVIVVAFLATLAMPFVIVEFFRQRRRASLSQQLPDAFDQMKRSVRAGQPLTSAMQQIANDFPPPLADEFAICCQKLELGLSHSTALQDLARRINIMEFQMFVVTVLVQRDVGGNIAEILASLSNVVRQRFRLAARVKALTAEGRMQALVLGALPIVAGGLMLIMNAAYIRVLLDYPKLLAGMVASEIIGALWIRRIVSFDY